MKNFLYILLFIVILLPAHAQEGGICFFQKNWKEALSLAQKENKKIFIDFYTGWCNPCLHMSKTIFPLPQVGSVYNKHFICLKIDAETEEGKKLAEQYEVHSFPTFVFVNPRNEEVIHRSVGAKTAEDFIADANGALNPKQSSVYLNQKYESGEYDTAFLKDYVRAKRITGERQAALKAFDQLMEAGAKLTDPDIWQLYCECYPNIRYLYSRQPGYPTPYIKQISDHYAQFTALFGKETIDAHLAGLTQDTPVQLIEQLCDFNGKEYNLKISQMTKMFREKKLEKAWDIADRLIADTTIDQRKFVEELARYTQVMPRIDKDLSFEQLARKIRYVRYVTYNLYNAWNDVYTHYAYAAALEYFFQRSVEEKKEIPVDLFTTPLYGKKTYSLENPLLKPKPRAKKK